MDPIEVMVVARGIERLLIAAGAVFSIYFGYKLFRSDIRAIQIADIKFLGWIVALKQVGPGVFFSLFGTIILSASVMNNMQFESKVLSKEPTGAEQERESSGSFIGSGSDKLQQSRVKALQAAIAVADCNDVESCSDLAALKSYKIYIETLRQEMLQKAFGKDILTFWKNNRNHFAGGQITDPAILERLRKVQPWFEGE